MAKYIYLGEVHPATFNVLAGKYPDLVVGEVNIKDNEVCVVCHESVNEKFVRKYQCMFANMTEKSESDFLRGVSTEEEILELAKAYSNMPFTEN